MLEEIRHKIATRLKERRVRKAIEQACDDIFATSFRREDVPMEHLVLMVRNRIEVLHHYREGKDYTMGQLRQLINSHTWKLIQKRIEESKKK